MRIEREDGLEILLEATNSLGDIIQNLQTVKVTESQHKLIDVFKKLHKLMENENPEPLHCSRCGRETDRPSWFCKGQSGYEVLCQQCIGSDGWVGRERSN